MASRSIICQSLMLRQKKLIRGKSRYFAITEFNIFLLLLFFLFLFFIIRSPTADQVCLFFFFNEYIGEAKQSPIFHARACKKEKSVVSSTHERNIICDQTQLDAIAHEQTIICMQLFAGYVVGFRLMKRKKNCYRMTTHLSETDFRTGTWSCHFQRVVSIKKGS